MGEGQLEPRTEFSFPFTPYAVQRDLMRELYGVCAGGGVGVFESPTGTGKSLSVICSTLQWRADEEARRALGRRLCRGGRPHLPLRRLGRRQARAGRPVPSPTVSTAHVGGIWAQPFFSNLFQV